MQTEQTLLSTIEALDAEGRHDDAIDELAKSTATGSILALTRLGKRLLVGDRAPYLPKEGASMVLEAASKGFGEALAQVGMMQITGIFQPKNVQTSISTLASAAEAGWVPAREQILLLCGATLEEAQSGSEKEGAHAWHKLIKHINLGFWLTVGHGKDLHADPLLRHYLDFIPEPVCDWLIRDSAHKLAPALVYDPINRQNIRKETRTNSIAQFNLVENEVLHFLLQEKMSVASNMPMQQMEATAILNYKPGEQIAEHYDFVDPDLPNYDDEIRLNGQRVITFLIYLNENYTGGETAFPRMGITHSGSKGEGIFFVNALPDGSPDLRTLHAGCPPSSGEKWIVSQFIRNRPVKYILD
jgi:prolyl 4-hydroxylase